MNSSDVNEDQRTPCFALFESCQMLLKVQRDTLLFVPRLCFFSSFACYNAVPSYFCLHCKTASINLCLSFRVPNVCTDSLPWIDYDTTWKLYLDIGDEYSIKQKLNAQAVQFWTKDMPPPNLDSFL